MWLFSAIQVSTTLNKVDKVLIPKDTTTETNVAFTVCGGMLGHVELGILMHTCNQVQVNQTGQVATFQQHVNM